MARLRGLGTRWPDSAFVLESWCELFNHSLKSALFSFSEAAETRSSRASQRASFLATATWMGSAARGRGRATSSNCAVSARRASRPDPVALHYRFALH